MRSSINRVRLSGLGTFNALSVGKRGSPGRYGLKAREVWTVCIHRFLKYIGADIVNTYPSRHFNGCSLNEGFNRSSSHGGRYTSNNGTVHNNAGG